jgi:beta-1,4-mannosyl-glycoprotein beta-1,4-N-acetylglucosaminyltransferase
MTSVHPSSKIYDLFLYFNEEDLLLARLRYLWDYVDFFVIVESAHSFSGIKKKYTCQEILEKNIPKYKEKVIIYRNDIYINSNDIRNKNLGCIDTSSVPLVDYLIENIPYYGGMKEYWINDFFQRELLQCALLELNPNDSDLVLVSDIDEIPTVESIDTIFKSNNNETTYFQMIESRHYINYISKELWIGTVSTSVSGLKSKGVNYIRFYPKRYGISDCLIAHESGWHFTSLGGIESLIIKVKSWGHQEFNNPITKLIMPYRLDRGLDVFGRNLGLTYLEDITPIYDSKLLKLLDKKFIGKRFTIPSNMFLMVNYFVIFLERTYQYVSRKI